MISSDHLFTLSVCEPGSRLLVLFVLVAEGSLFGWLMRGSENIVVSFQFVTIFVWLLRGRLGRSILLVLRSIRRLVTLLFWLRILVLVKFLTPFLRLNWFLVFYLFRLIIFVIILVFRVILIIILFRLLLVILISHILLIVIVLIGVLVIVELILLIIRVVIVLWLAPLLLLGVLVLVSKLFQRVHLRLFHLHLILAENIYLLLSLGTLSFVVGLQFVLLVVRVESVPRFFRFERLTPTHWKLVLFFVRVNTTILTILRLLVPLIQSPSQRECVGLFSYLLTDVWHFFNLLLI